MRIALVHDDLVQWGGAERVLAAISETFPEAPIYTSVFDKSNKILSEKFKGKKIVTSFMQNIPGWKFLYKALLPVYPLAFEQFDFSQFDVVLSQTTRFAKSVITKPQTMHICYCHTPPRFLWNLSGEKMPQVLSPILEKMRDYDFISSKRVDYYLAGSKNAQKKIKSLYKKHSDVLYPFVEIDKFDQKSFDGGYFLIVARLNNYKRVDLALKVFSKRKERLIIVGVGPQLNYLKKIAAKSSNIEFLENVSEELLIKLYLGCKAFILTGEEDFGMTALEAQAAGKGVIAFAKGGVLETVSNNETGIYFEEQTEDSLNIAIEKFYTTAINPADCKEMAKKFSKEKFRERLLTLVSQTCLRYNT